MEGNIPTGSITVFGADDDATLRGLLNLIIGRESDDSQVGSPGPPIRRRRIDRLTVGQFFTDGLPLVCHLQQLPSDQLGDIVVVTDYNMPHVSGADVALWALAHNVPCLVLSGNPAEYLEDIEPRLTPEQRKIVKHRLLAKPASLQQIRDALTDLVNECFPAVALQA